ncbi:MAG: enhanced serine sensitivity protein SseB [Ruminococcus sp.]|nr:enhanced serine sensitivity protein SseB [Ruminococcus sp.]
MKNKNQKPIKNPELLEAIKNMQENNTPENVNRMIDCVMKAQFITPGTVSKPRPVAKTDKNGSTVMQQETQVQFQLIENQNKEKFFPAFTDKEEKEKWQISEGKDDVIMNFDGYAQVLSDEGCDVKGFVINPFGRSVAFPKPMVMSLKQQKDFKSNSGLQQQSFSADENVQLGDPDPDEYPIDMMAAIINFLQERDDVNSAYLKMFKRENDEKPSYLVIVNFEGDKMEEIFKGISACASPHLSGYQLSMMPYSLPFAQKAVEGVEPFYSAED